MTQLNNLSHIIDVLEKSSDMMKKVETPRFQRKKEHNDKTIPRTGNNLSGLKVPLAMVRGSQAGLSQPAEVRIAVLTILTIFKQFLTIAVFKQFLTILTISIILTILTIAVNNCNF